MKTRFLLSSFTCVLLLLVSSFSPEKMPSLIDDVLTQTNRFRKENGLAPLTINDNLNALAQKHSSDMARGRTAFGHNGFAKRNRVAQKTIGSINSFAENVAYGATSGKDAVKGWKNSPAHRRNMLGRFKYIGIGVAKDRRGRIYYTQLFAG